jgi:uncharacterized alpha-E superfamily protein
MLSRVAENIFWMSRYMERTNIHLRNLQTLYIASQDGVPVMGWEDICRQYDPGQKIKSDNAAEILKSIVFENSIDSSLCNNVFRARENARSAQDHITKELWQSLNDFHHQMRDEHLKLQISHGDPITVFDQLIKQCMLYYGIVDNSMFRREGLYFLRIGGLIERALLCIMLLKRQLIICDITKADSVDAVSWRYLLISLSGYEYYLRSNAGSLIPESIYKQILYEENFPHSITYALNQTAVFSTQLDNENSDEPENMVSFLLGKTIAHLKYSEPENNTNAKLSFLDEIEANIYEIVQAFDKHYFKVVY